MLISFIIPIYNLPDHMLTECLRSIKSLPIAAGDYEVVAVDDGSLVSPEATVRAVFPQAVVITQPNGGLSAARNAGIEASTGSYIQFVDGDDMLLPSYKQVVDTLKKSRLDLLMFGFSRKKNVSSTAVKEPVGITTGADYMAINNLKASACGYIASREVIGNVRFATGLLHEDELFTPQVLLASRRVASLNIQAYYYRERTDSITKSRDVAHLKRRLDDTFSVISQLGGMAKALDGIKQTALQRRVAQLSMDYLYNTILLMPKQLRQSAEKLRSIGLFPLPKGSYTIKYSLFRYLSKIALK